MADRNQERSARATLAKQAYLRQHIPANDYEDFAEFCEETVGNTVIEGWSLEFVCQLVDQFRRKQTERRETERQQPQEQKTFHLYQTGTATEMKELAAQIKQEAVKPPPSSARSTNKPKEESALEVLDSIFKDQKQMEFSSNKYDKAIFQSRNFWELGAAEQKQRENQKQSPSFAKKNKPVETTQFATIKIEPEKFEKIFQTGLKLPEVKKEAIQMSPKTKAASEAHSNGIAIKQSSKPNEDISNQPVTVHSDKRNDIKLLSVKKLNSSKIPYDGDIIFPQPFKEFVSCFKSFERHTLSIKNLKVSIKDHEIISRSFFSSDYVMYHIKVSPANIICKRNLEDFQKLRKNIESVYPGIRLPYLQKIGLFGSQTNPDIIEKQKRYLSFFLEDLLSHSETKNFRILEDFLTLKDHKQMKRKFEEYDKLSKIKAIQQLCLLEGVVKVDISEPTRQYNELVQGFTSRVKNYWGNQQRILAQINDLHQRISSLYGELAEAIMNVSKEINEFNRKVTLNEVQSLDDAFQSLLRYTNEHISLHDRQSQIMRNIFLARTRYERQNMNTLDAVATTRNDLTRSYLKRRDNEKSGDNLEYLSQRLKEFKTGITEESKSLTVLKYQCGYINDLMMTESHHYFTLLAHKLERSVATATTAKREAAAKTIELCGMVPV